MRMLYMSKVLIGIVIALIAAGGVIMVQDRDERPAQTCEITNCHDLDITCGQEGPEVCTAIYKIGEFCRQFASCQIVDGDCVPVLPPTFRECKTCVEKCTGDGAWECEAKCRDLYLPTNQTNTEPSPPNTSPGSTGGTENDWSTIVTGLNQTASVFGVSVTPVSMIEGSPCPSGAECIWEGGTRVTATLAYYYGPNDSNSSGNSTGTGETYQFGIGETKVFGNFNVKFVSVDKRGSTNQADYLFTFAVRER